MKPLLGPALFAGLFAGVLWAGVSALPMSGAVAAAGNPLFSSSVPATGVGASVVRSAVLATVRGRPAAALTGPSAALTATSPAPTPTSPATEPASSPTAPASPPTSAEPAAPISAPSAEPTISPPAVPGSMPGPGVPSVSVPEPDGSANPAGGALPNPEPGRSASPAARTHLHRPGTDVDGDVLTGSLASQVYVLKGNVILRSDPKTDREIADASESEEPLTVTADEIDIDKLGLSYVAKGNVHFVQGSRSGRADLAMLDQQAHTLDLVGNASVMNGDRRAAAAKMHYNTLDKQFLGSGNVRIYQPLPTPNPKPSGTPASKRKRRFPI